MNIDFSKLKWEEVERVSKGRSDAVTQVKVSSYYLGKKDSGSRALVTQIVIPEAVAEEAGIKKGITMRIQKVDYKGTTYLRFVADKKGRFEVGSSPQGKSLIIKAQGILDTESREGTLCEHEVDNGDLVVAF